MNSLWNEIKYQFKTGGILTQLITINIAVFVIVNLVGLISFLAGNGGVYSSLLVSWLAVPSGIGNLIIKPWTLFTYMFLHHDFFHLLSNMLVFFFGGRLFAEFLNDKRLLPTYIMSGLVGALLYIIAFNVFPVFEGVKSFSFALGASASVLGVLVAISTYLPNYTVHLILFGPVRLKYIAIFCVALDFLSISKGNAGGHIAHIGGALWGMLYALQLKKGRDLHYWPALLIERIRSLFSPRKSKLRVEHVNKTNFDKKNKQQVIDDILDKISKSGYDSLTKQEKEILFKVSKDKI